jgi:arachidonate 15-lipoxygenase
MSTPTLLQEDPKPESRQAELLEQAAPYSWDYDQFKGIAAAPEVPSSEHPSLSWGLEMAEVLIKVVVNAAHIESDLERTDPNHPEHREFAELLSDAKKGGLHLAFEHLQGFIQGENDEHTPVPEIGRYGELYQSIAMPDIAHSYHQDTSFARMRIAGPNPMEIRQTSALGDHFPVTEAHFGRALEALSAQGIQTGEDSLARALAEGRAFIADYAALDGAVGGSFPRGPKFICAPLALFITTEHDRTLVPIAIQCAQRPSEDAPIFTPADGWAWMMAKTAATVADGNFHQAVRHLSHTHLVMGPFRIAAKKTLPPRHPIARLLDPHLEGILYINDAANTQLMGPKGGVDAVMACDIDVSRAVSIQGVKDWRFRSSMITKDLSDRGLMDRETLPDFPYRDDGLLVWNATRDWIEAFVRTYYRADADVVLDTELQSFFSSVQAEDGGRIKGLGQVRSIHYLVDVLAHIIFTGSAQHAAVNFPQLPIMSYAPAYPLCAYGKPPGREPVSEADYLAMLPALDMAQFQGTLGFLLGTLNHGQLGHYHKGFWSHFAGDHRLNHALKGFQGRLDQIESLIEERNNCREPYDILRPSQIPQSVNI